jgi:serine/threonine protein kinase
MSDQYIGSYKVLKKIGAGGMATVYLAVHQDVPNLKVVLKILSDPSLVERFRQEADKLALLDGHAHICQIKHFFNHGDDIVIAMEYIDGMTPDDRMKVEGRLPVSEALRIISDLLATLAFAHEKGIFHRDIKPGNIMVDRNGQVKIIDFGIAKAKTDPNLTIAGSACGTPAYMPPEQFNPTDTINYALADIYAAGTTLFYMLTGKLPYEAENVFALRDAKLFQEPVKPRAVNPDISKDLEAVILKALQKSPEDRFQSALEMKQAIDALRGDATMVEQPAKADRSSTPPIRKTGISHSKTPWLAGIGLVVAVVAVYLLFFTGPSASPPAAPKPVSPVDAETIRTSTPSFAWQVPPGQIGTVALEYADNAEFANGAKIDGLSGGSFTPTQPLTNGRYFWRLRAIDNQGHQSDYSAVYSFTIDVTAVPAQVGLAIAVRPEGDIYVDGQSLGRGKSSAQMTLDAGRHIIRVENRSSIERAFVDTVDLVAGANLNRSFAFTFASETSSTAQVTLGEVRVGSKPVNGATVYIDGQLKDRPTPAAFRVSPGRHVISAKLTLDGKELERTDTIIVVADSSYRVIFDFEH